MVHQPDLDYTCISIGGGESLGSSQKVLSCFTISSKISFLDLWLQLSLSATAWSCLMASEHMEQSSPCNAMEFTSTNLNWKSKLLTFLIKHFMSVRKLGLVLSVLLVNQFFKLVKCSFLSFKWPIEWWVTDNWGWTRFLVDSVKPYWSIEELGLSSQPEKNTATHTAWH